MKTISPDIVFDEVTKALGVWPEDFEPHAHSGSVARSCLAYVLRHGLGYSDRQVAEEIGWASRQAAVAAIKKLEKRMYDDSPRLRGMHCKDFCDNIVRSLSVRYDGVRIIPVGYGHTPLS